MQWRFYLHLYPFGDLTHINFHEGFHVPTNKGTFLRDFLIVSELLVSYELIMNEL
jgi:galactitol-specific phosphotransferase system IIC component